MKYSIEYIRIKILNSIFNNYPSLNIRKICFLKHEQGDDIIYVDVFDSNDLYRTLNIPYVDYGMNLEDISFDDFFENESMVLFNYRTEQYVSIPIIGITDFIDILGNTTYNVYLYHDHESTNYEVRDMDNKTKDVVSLSHGYNIIKTHYIRKDYTNLNFNIIDSII